MVTNVNAEVQNSGQPPNREPIVNNTYQSELFISDVHRNEQVNIAALSKGRQTVLCSNLAYGKCYALWPMKSDSYKYAYSQEGLEWRDFIYDHFGCRLDGFHIEFAAKVWASCHLVENTLEFWQELKDVGLFIYWDPELGPYQWYSETIRAEVQILRVYKVDRDLKPYVERNVGYRNYPAWRGGYLACKGTPVLSDQQMVDQFERFERVCSHHGSRARIRI